MRFVQLVAALALPVLLSAAPATTRRAPSTARTDPLARADAAKEVLDAWDEQIRIREVTDEEDLAMRPRWAKRLLLAEMDGATTHSRRVTAANHYLSRMITMGRELHRIGKREVPRTTRAAANSYVQEAREIVACVEAGRPVPSGD